MKTKPNKKPRVAIYYDNRFGRNDGPPLYWFEACKRLGYETVHLLPEGDTGRHGKFDVHLWVDWGEDGLPWKEWYPPKDGGKTVYIASDTHLDKGYRLNKARQFDYAFFNQKRATDAYTEYLTFGKHPFKLGQNTQWLPHAAEPLAYPHTEQAKKYDVCFIGHVQEQPGNLGFSRVDFLDRMFSEFPNFYFGTRDPSAPGKNLFEDAARKFNQSRIVLNISIGDDINMRVFETLSAGAFLLTNELPTLDQLFKTSSNPALARTMNSPLHCATFGSLDQAVANARWYLEHEEERERIAAAGHAEVMKHHTYEERVKTVFKILGCL